MEIADPALVSELTLACDVAEEVGLDRPIENTAQLVAIYNALYRKDPQHYRLPLLRDLALAVVEQLEKSSLTTPALLQEALVLGRMSEPKVMYELLITFHQALEGSSLIHVDLVEGFAVCSNRPISPRLPQPPKPLLWKKPRWKKPPTTNVAGRKKRER